MALPDILTGHTTVQASAGSGKTYLLISRIVRLLLSGVEPGHILAITFTRKAANEMQTRLLERLFTLATCDEGALIKCLQELQLENTAPLLQRARALYENVLRNDQPVKTTTFHAFCQELLRRFPMEADVPPGFDLIDKITLLYDEAWEALMLEATEQNNQPLVEALQHLFIELGLYNSHQALTSFIEHRSDWWAYTMDAEEPVTFARENLQQQLKVDPAVNPLQQLFSNSENFSLLNEFHQLLVKHDTKTNLKTSELIYKVIDETLEQGTRFDLFKQCFLTQDGSPLKTRKASATQEKKMGAEGQQRFLELHMLISNKLVETIQQLAILSTYTISSAWYLAGEHFLKHFQKIKKEQRQLDFTDLEWQTYLLLNKSNNALWIQYKLDQRIEHLLIDEFQDTNPTQWRFILPLLEELAASEDERNRSVFLVGDEKQSIYRFRRAEPRLFIAAEKWLSEHLHANTFPLSHSWRSSPAIIDFINQLFSQEEFKSLLPGFITHETHQKELWGKVTLLPLSLKNNDEIKDEPTSLRNPLVEPRFESINQSYFNEGLMIAEEIKKLVKDKTLITEKGKSTAVNYNDIIILLRTRTHAGEYERALRQTGIPYIGAERGTLLESLEINDLLDLIQWLILPFDNLSLAGILRSPLFAVTDEILMAIKQSGKGNWLEKLASYVEHNPDDKNLVRAYKLLTQWQESASKLPVHDLLDKIYSEANVLARYRAAFPAHLKHRVSANLNRLLELALEMDSGRYPSITRFAAWINELRQLEKEAPDEPVTQGAEQRVRLLSVHSAKGLEAPVIFLADSANSPSNKKAYSALIDWPAEKQKPDYFLLNGAKKDLDNFSQTCQQQQQVFEDREDTNLLYVALTRAKQLLYISGSEPKSKDLGWYGKILKAFEPKEYAEDQPLALTTFSHPDKQELKQTQTQSGKNKINIAKELSQPLNIKTQNIDISPSQQATHFYQHADTDVDSTERGIIMHQMLNQLSRNPASSFNTFKLSLQNKSIQSDDELEKDWSECQEIVSADKFKTYFNPASFDKCYNEVPIQFKDGDNMVYGIIDRLLIKDSHAIIIDYKTHAYASTENIPLIAADYKNQMVLYQKGVELLWPGYTIKPVLIFTSPAEEYCFS